MKKDILKVVVGVFLSMSITAVAHAGFLGGYINTAEERFVVVSDGGARGPAVIAGSKAPIVIGRRESRRIGQLLITYPNGRVYQWNSSYVDRYGFRVALPTTRFDKVVFLDLNHRIVGGIGLTGQEIKSIANGFKDADISTATDYISPAGLSTLFRSVKTAAGNVRRAYKMNEEELKSIFSMSVAGMAGHKLQGVVNGILGAAQENHAFSGEIVRNIFGAGKVWKVNALIRGVGVVSNGDNGGTVEKCVDVVSNGDNGGTVEGCGVLVEGMKNAHIRLPELGRTGINAVCTGSFFMFN